MENKLYPLNKAAEILGVSVKTLQRWDVDKKIETVKTPNGRRRIPESEIRRILGDINTNTVQSKKIVIYGRVSSHEQKAKGDLERQIEFMKSKIDIGLYEDFKIITDVGSGLNDKRKGLQKLMNLAMEGKVTDIAIRYKDRLTRFGFHYLEEFFRSHNVKLHVFDDHSKQKDSYEELVDDLISIVTSFAGKLYGNQSGKNKILKEKVKGVIEDVKNLPSEVERDAIG